MPITIFNDVEFDGFVADRWAVQEWSNVIDGSMLGVTVIDLLWDFNVAPDDSMFLDDWQAVLSAVLGRNVLLTDIEHATHSDGGDLLRLKLAGAHYPPSAKPKRRRVRKPRATVVVVPLKSRAME